MDDIGSDYLDHLRVERGLSPGTIVAYTGDLARLRAFASARGQTLLILAAVAFPHLRR